MITIKNNIYLKIGVIIGLTILLLIPTSMIQSLVHERESRQTEAVMDVSSKWGGEQQISGPFISIPFLKSVKQYNKDLKTETIVTQTDFIHILPKKLNITGNINPESRHRGIFEIIVYNSNLQLTGEFDAIDWSQFDVPLKNIQFQKAKLIIGISDLRGIERPVSLEWNDSNALFNPGVSNFDLVAKGINAPLHTISEEAKKNSFKLTIALKGSQKLYFTPLGKMTDVRLKSTWNNPSYNGAFLPDNRTTTAKGFTAHWNVLHLNRNFPQWWTGSKYSINNSQFGVDLILPVDNYQKSYRSIKYALLLVGFTFLVFFFIEVVNKIFIHPIQYALVGIALVVFYSLLLAISEHLPFDGAFLLSALATLLLITGYVKAILHSNKFTALIASILLILYTFIYIMIQLQDLALLFGSIGIFLILCIVMYFSRKIDWSQLAISEEKEAEKIEE